MRNKIDVRWIDGMKHAKFHGTRAISVRYLYIYTYDVGKQPCLCALIVFTVITN